MTTRFEGFPHLKRHDANHMETETLDRAAVATTTRGAGNAFATTQKPIWYF